MLDAGSKLASRIAPKEQAFHWILHRWLEEVYHAVPGQSSEVGFDDRKPFITSFFVVTSSILQLTKSLAGTCYRMSMYVACFLAVSYQPPHIAKHLAAFQMSWVSKWKVDEAKQSSPAGTTVSSALHGLQHENMSLTRTDTTQHPPMWWYPSATCLILDSQLNIGIGLNFLKLQGSSKHSPSSLSSFDAHYQGSLGAPGSATAAVQWICFEHTYQENAPTHPKDLASYTWRRAAPSHIYSGAHSKEHPKILLWWKVGKMNKCMDHGKLWPILSEHKHQNDSKTFKNSKRQSRDAQNIPKPIHQKQNHAAYRRKNQVLIKLRQKKRMLTSSKDFMPGHSKSQGQSCTWSRFLARAWSHVLVSLCMQNLQGVRQESHNLSFV